MSLINKKVNQQILGCIFICFTISQCLTANAQLKTTELSYDYSKIKEHPRLLLGGGEENLIKFSIQRNPEFKKIDSYIKQVADNLLLEKPLVFKKKGKRLLAVSREAFTRLYYLSYSYRMTKDKKYLNRAELELNSLSNFESWNPSHFLDVGEMCMAVAIAYDWLYDDLKETTKQNVRKAIVEKAFAPSYIKEYSWFLERHNNWNSVCNAGLVYGALAIFEEEKEQSVAIIERALISNKLPLKAYGPDGNYPEGPGYWNYGTSFQVMLTVALESALGSDKGLSNAPGFLQSAYYMLFSAGTSGKYFNYSDCGLAAEASSSMFWFANKLNDPSLIYLEIPLINSGAYTSPDKSNAERFLPNTLVFGKNLTLSKIKTPSKNTFTGAGITPVTLVRTSWNDGEGKYLGIKGGKASDAHGHMDQGTFVYDVGNIRWAMDFGLQSYITLESKGVDLWNMSQNSQRWDVFRYNNLNHNTLTINNQRHNANERAEIINNYNTKKEKGAEVDLTAVLNLNNELKSATRKAIIVNNDYLKIEDQIETNDKSVDLRWNMVTPANAEIADNSTIKLSLQGKIMYLKFKSDIPFKLAIRPSANPKEYKSEFGNYYYGDYNQENKNSVMVGFDSKIPANKSVKFTVTFVEGESDLLLEKNTIILDAPNPSSAVEGNNIFHSTSPIGFSSSGTSYLVEGGEWVPYGITNIKELQNKSVKFRIDAKKIEATGIVKAGIDRSANGQLGVRGGEGTGIDKGEGYVLGLDLTSLNSSVKFELTKIAFTLLDGGESCTIVNRQNPGKMMILRGEDKKDLKEVKISPNNQKVFLDISSLGISLNGGKNHNEFLSLFNTSDSGSFRVSGFEFAVK